MAKYEGTIESPRPVEEVFAYLADFSNASEWDPSSVSSRPLDEPGAHEGARYEVVSKFMGREVPLTYETLSLEEPSRVVLRGESESVVSIDEITFSPRDDGGTTVGYDADLQLKGGRRILDPLLGVAFRRICERARDRMEEVLA
jgi:uncharacterized protein YndB with AHSA1/START domain